MDKEKLLILLRDYTQMQANALEYDKIEDFLEVIERRQVVIDQISMLGEGITQKQREILVQIVEIDQENQKVFRTKLEETKEILKNVRKQKKLHKIYTHYEEHMEEGSFYDKRSKGV